MHGNSRKRKAEEQLSPYSEDPADPQPVPETENGSKGHSLSSFNKAKARRNRDAQPENRPALKGIFGKVSLSESVAGPTEKGITDNRDLIAGVNRSFLKAVTRVLERQSNKDLSYLFKQYTNFINEIKQDKKAEKQ